MTFSLAHSRYGLLAVLALVLANAAAVQADDIIDPGIGSVWSFDGGEFRDTGNGQWFEYVNGAATYSYREIYRDWQRVDLFDETRNMIVELSQTVATVRRGGQVLMTISRSPRGQEWSYSNGTGRFVQTSPGAWSEFQNGAFAFAFQEVGRLDHEVYLYDASRDISVRLIQGEAIVTRNGVLLLTIPGNFVR